MNLHNNRQEHYCIRFGIVQQLFSWGVNKPSRLRSNRQNFCDAPRISSFHPTSPHSATSPPRAPNFTILLLTLVMLFSNVRFVMAICKRGGTTYKRHDFSQGRTHCKHCGVIKTAKARKVRKCRSCGTDFFPAIHNQRYCSKECQNRDGQRRWRERAQAAMQQVQP